MEEDFESKKHVTKHLTLGRFGQTEEATRVNSWEELDYLSWKLFKARNLTPDKVTPEGIKTIVDASDKYRRAYGSYRFGNLKGIKPIYIVLMMGAVVGVFILLYFTGHLGG